MPAPDSDGLPAYTVRRSERARRIRLTVSARDGIVVVVPASSDARQVPALVRAHAAWLRKAEARLAERRAHMLSATGPLPTTVESPALGLTWAVVLAGGEGPARVRERGGALQLSGGRDDDERRVALRRWVSRVAQHWLVPWLFDLASAEGLHVARVQVRAQRTRWGSCSRRGSISLNRDLIFLPPDLARYVLVHELVHLRVPDHSPRFWRELARLEPDALALRKALRDAWRHVPPWAIEGDLPSGEEG
jgi:predicted metal-dependent hydrolase